MRTKSKESIFKRITKKAEELKYVLGLLVFFTPLIISGIKSAIPYLNFIKRGPELVHSVDELKTGLLVATAAVSANMETIDSTIYTINWKGHEYKGILSKSKSGIIYVSVRDGEIGEQMFAAAYDNKWFQYYFIDFDGNRINLENE